jgi:TetR/AcrR family transcriptional regulator, repressor for uid operon
MAKGTARLLELAFDPASEPPDDAMSERVLDAALTLVAASGARHLTMDDVAARAGVGRMTVYRRFGGRQQLLDALAVRECRRCLAQIAVALDPHKPVDERATELVVATLTVIREHPMLARLARAEPEALLRELNRDSSAVFRLVRDFLVAQIRSAQAAGELPDGDPAALAEIAVRLGASFVLIPDSAIVSDEEGQTRETVRRLLAPVLSGQTPQPRRAAAGGRSRAGRARAA